MMKFVKSIYLFGEIQYSQYDRHTELKEDTLRLDEIQRIKLNDIPLMKPNEGFTDNTI